jgi:aspartate/methionine/tyrosine aminotransferase
VRPIRIPDRAARISPPQFDILNSRAAELRSEGHPVISLGQALPGFGPPPPAVQALRESLDDPDTHVYSADAGRSGLRRALCERLRSAHRADVQPDEVIVTAGGNQAFMLAVMTLVDPGQEVLLPAPYFVNHEMAIAAAGAVPREVPLDEGSGFALRWRDLEPHLSNRTRAVVVCTPSNPTGSVASRQEMTRVVRELSARGIVLFSDETYGRFVYEGEFCSLASIEGWRDNGIVVGTLSKTFGMTGWRVGYLLARGDVGEAAIRIHDAMVICAPVPSQAGAETAVRDCWDHADRFRPGLLERRRLLAARLGTIPSLRWTPTAGGFFAFVRVHGCTDSTALAHEILERTHVVTIPGSTFGRCGEGFVRLSYGAVSLDELAAALDRLDAFFRS